MATPSLDDLTNCSICLETFTRPKVLPCQHTYCYSCLLSIGKDQTTITCPQCREECHIPEDGIDNFRDNILANDLLALCLAQKKNLCKDCELNPVVSPCSHCNSNVCAPCLIEHIRLSTELNITLNEMKEKIPSELPNEKREKLQRSRVQCEKQLQCMKKFHRSKLTELFKKSRSWEKFMEKICGVYDDILKTPETELSAHFTFLSEKTVQCKTIASLKSLQNDIGDLKIVVLELDQDSEENFQFVPNVGPDTLGRIEISKVAVNVQGKYEDGLSSRELLTGLQRTLAREVYGQNQLPKNVDYFSKGFVAIGPDEQPNNLFRGAEYRVATGEIYAADNTNNRIMRYGRDGRKADVFYELTSPYDVAISTDGQFVYIAAKGQFVKVDANGREIQTIKTCSLGLLNDCISVVCHREFTVIVDRQFASVIIFDESGTELRHFGSKNLRDPTAVAISDDGEMFVTNDTDRSILVFNWNGEFMETFLSGEKTHSFGEAAVDGDGLVYVTNKLSDTIDVFDRQKNLLTTISGPGKLPGQLNHPFRISLTPEGRIMVTDKGGGSSDHRLQMF